MTCVPSLTVPVIVVVFTIIYIYFTTLFVFIHRWFGLLSSPRILNSIVFIAVSFMCIFNYASVISTDPGQVPSSHRPDANIPIHEIKHKRAEVRYCQKCSLYKPPRAHHCRVCRRCVLRMDHRCIWINNCVGHANYKVFFLFVLYAAISCFYSLVLLCESNCGPSEGRQQTRIMYFVSGILLIPLSLALGTLLRCHVYLISYDIGTYENLTTVLGPNIFCWVCPSSRHIGLRFRTLYDRAR